MKAKTTLIALVVIILLASCDKKENKPENYFRYNYKVIEKRGDKTKEYAHFSSFVDSITGNVMVVQVKFTKDSERQYNVQFYQDGRGSSLIFDITQMYRWVDLVNPVSHEVININEGSPVLNTEFGSRVNDTIFIKTTEKW